MIPPLSVWLKMYVGVCIELSFNQGWKMNAHIRYWTFDSFIPSHHICPNLSRNFLILITLWYSGWMNVWFIEWFNIWAEHISLKFSTMLSCNSKNAFVFHVHTNNEEHFIEHNFDRSDQLLMDTHFLIHIHCGRDKFQ